MEHAHFHLLNFVQRVEQLACLLVPIDTARGRRALNTAMPCPRVRNGQCSQRSSGEHLQRCDEHGVDPLVGSALDTSDCSVFGGCSTKEILGGVDCTTAGAVRAVSPPSSWCVL